MPVQSAHSDLQNKSTVDNIKYLLLFFTFVILSFRHSFKDKIKSYVYSFCDNILPTNIALHYILILNTYLIQKNNRVRYERLYYKCIGK